MKKKIALIDFGAGNLHSVFKAFKYIGANVEITNDLKIIQNADSVVFPGVGAFGAVMDSIRKCNLEDAIKSSAKSLKPFLGICVGMQVLFESGEEKSDVNGLGIFKGTVMKFRKAKKIPHIGWNNVKFCDIKTTKFHPEQSEGSTNVNKYYFVHSYYVLPEDENIIFARTEHDGEEFASVIKKDNLIAVQFHPEKSGETGLQFLEAFIKN